MEFKYECAGPDGPAELFGVKIFEYHWQSTGLAAEVTDPKYGRQLRLNVYSVQINGRPRLFAAGEMSAGVWAFFLPKD